MNKKIIQITFFSLAVIFLLLMVEMFVPGVGAKLFKFLGPVVLFAEWGLFALLGAILLFLTIKNKVKEPLRKFLLLTGVSAAGFVIFVLLHNLTSGLLSALFNKEIEEPVFFILATIVCPIGFLVGAIRSAIIFFKKDAK
ncbi:hypothetical protein KJ616_03215 [Patescibacteria group bacterium]|nr:hypothetical protein [Patescibacteria group bacterium]